MADRQGHASQSGGFPLYLVAGVALLVVLIVVAFLTVGSDVGIPALILLGVVVLAAVGFRLITSRAGGPEDSAQGGLPKQPMEGERPLGDTTEAHDEISPHDIPKDSPARQAAEELAEGSGAQGTTRGHEAGANETDGDVVGPDERQGAQLPT
jgi:hypothetical protein